MVNENVSTMHSSACNWNGDDDDDDDDDDVDDDDDDEDDDDDDDDDDELSFYNIYNFIPI